MPRLTKRDLKLRQSMITSTDAVVLAGEDTWGRTAFDVWAEKTGPIVRLEETIPMRLGHVLEPFVLELLAEEHHRTFARGKTVRHPELAHVGASIDGISEDAVAEAKVVGFTRVSDWDEQIPDYVLVQVTQAAAVADKKRIFVGMLSGTRFRSFEVERNDSLASALLEQDEAFWSKHVAPKRPPELTAASEKALKGLYPRVRYGMIRATDDVEELARAYFKAKAEREAAAELEEKAEAELKLKIGENEGILGDGWTAKWSERAGSVSWKSAYAALAKQTKKDVEVDAFRGKGSRQFRCAPTGQGADES